MGAAASGGAGEGTRRKAAEWSMDRRGRAGTSRHLEGGSDS